MMGVKNQAVLDWARVGAAVLVICNHTSPLFSLSAAGDFFLTRVLARLAVPLFLMISGYFLEQSGWRSARRLLKKTALLYAAAVALYLPLNLYAGQITPDFFRKLVTDGTLYHLWYFPALLLGVPIARWLRRLGLRAGLTAAGVLYLIGLGGDSYYGLAMRLPGAESLYGSRFSGVHPHPKRPILCAAVSPAGRGGPAAFPADGRAGDPGRTGPHDRRGLLAAEPWRPAP